MNYSELSKAQKRAVDFYVELEPSLRTATCINRQTVEELFFKCREIHGKFGYPNWIVKGEKVARGLYAWPGPESVQTAQTPVINLRSIKAPQNDEFEKEFFQEMAESGII
jgi:hypothetical protein